MSPSGLWSVTAPQVTAGGIAAVLRNVPTCAPNQQKRPNGNLSQTLLIGGTTRAGTVQSHVPVKGGPPSRPPPLLVSVGVSPGAYSDGVGSVKVSPAGPS